MPDFNANKTIYNGFQVTEVIPLKELKCTLRTLKHLETGASILHIENDDPENVFCLSFQTLPSSSNGVAHILEHTVLCGSAKFPVKDPFFAMNRRSLNTFMNALTGADFTCYPAATQIPQDFYNLLDVYLDAVFHPHLQEKSFRQEGHRMEFEIPDNPETPLTYRGIVFNEMKGVLNSASSRMHEAIHNALFPNITYGVNSGGDPKEIPELTYPELIAFHRNFYHPSRCLFFFYGNLPLEKHLDFIQDRILGHTNPALPLPPIPLQPRFTAPRHIVENYPIAMDEPKKDRTLISFGWLTCQILEQETCLALGILEIILLDTDASPLKKALLKSGLCKQVSSYIDTEVHEVPFTIHLKGCNPQNTDALQNLIQDTLELIIEQGISQESIDNAIHQFEFHRSEITGDYYPFGLTLFMRSGLLKQHGGKPEDGLLIHTLFDNIRKKSHENPHYFTDVLDQWLLKNPHFVSVTLVPDSTLEKKERFEEQERLIMIQKNLSEGQTKQIIQDAKELKAFQDMQEEEDVEVLPKVSLTDIPKPARDFPLQHENVGPLSIYRHTCFTNEIGYADIFFDLPPLTEKELIYARLFTVLIHQLGCKGKSYETCLDAIQAHTGGISPYLTLHIQANDHNQFFPAFALRGKALHRNMEKLLPLMHDFISAPDFTDRSRLKEIIHKHCTGLENSLNQGALKYAINLSASAINDPSHIANLWYGLDYYHKIRDIAHHFDQHEEELIEMMTSLSKKILISEKPELVISSDQELYNNLKKHQFYGLLDLKTAPQSPWKCEIDLPHIEHQGRIISSPVAFIGKVFNTVPYTHPDNPSLNLAAFLFDNLTLHKKIREEGGAYGGGAVCNSLSGNFYFYSYRDPVIASSLAAFRESIDNVLQGQFDEKDLEEAKMEMMQDIDSPISPGHRADIAYSWIKEGKTNGIRQTYRDRLLATTCEDIISAVQKHIATQFDQGKTVVFAGKELLEKENSLLEAEGRTPLKILPIHS